MLGCSLCCDFIELTVLNTLQDSTSCRIRLQVLKNNLCKHFLERIFGWQCSRKKKKKSQPAVIFCIRFQGTANELHNLSSEEKKKDEKGLMKHFWQLLQTILEKRRERLNALKWVFLTFALLSHWNSTSSFFMFLTSCVKRAMEEKPCDKLEIWQSFSDWSTRYFWKAM